MGLMRGVNDVTICRSAIPDPAFRRLATSSTQNIDGFLIVVDRTFDKTTNIDPTTLRKIGGDEEVSLPAWGFDQCPHHERAAG